VKGEGEGANEGVEGMHGSPLLCIRGALFLITWYSVRAEVQQQEVPASIRQSLALVYRGARALVVQHVPRCPLPLHDFRQSAKQEAYKSCECKDSRCFLSLALQVSGEWQCSAAAAPPRARAAHTTLALDLCPRCAAASTRRACLSYPLYPVVWCTTRG
jgi:hypothetical protein